jgi:HK97 family phage prohead protease
LGPWNLSAFRANPIILFGHDYRSLPVARCTSVGWDGEALSGTVEFIEPSISPEAEKVFQLVKAGFMRACSVGMVPLDPPKANPKGGYDYGRVELLEVSLVPVPSQPDALAKALRAGTTSPTSDEAMERAVWLAASLTVAAEEGERSMRQFLSTLPESELKIVEWLADDGYLDGILSDDPFKDATPEEIKAAEKLAAEQFALEYRGKLPEGF